MLLITEPKKYPKRFYVNQYHNYISTKQDIWARIIRAKQKGRRTKRAKKKRAQSKKGATKRAQNKKGEGKKGTEQKGHGQKGRNKKGTEQKGREITILRHRYIQGRNFFR